MALSLNQSALRFVREDKLFPAGLMHLPYVSLVDDKTIRLRDNGMMRSVRVDGLDAMTTDTAKLENIQRALAAVCGQLGESFTVYVHRISRQIKVEDQARKMENPGFAGAVQEKWSRHLLSRGLRDRSLTISVVYTPKTLEKISLFAKKVSQNLRRGDKKTLEALSEVVRFLQSGLGDVNSRVLTASSGELLGFLGSIQTANETPIFPPVEFNVTADAIFTERTTFKDNGFELTEGANGDRFGAIRVLKNYPAQTWVTMFDDFALPCDFVITQSWSPIGNTKAGDAIQKRRRQMRATNDVRQSAYEQLGVASEDVMSQALAFGEHQMSVSLIAPSKEALRDHISEMESIGSQLGTYFVKDPLIVKAHYFSQFPGNRVQRVRSSLITNVNFADFASLHASSRGKPGANVPWETPIALLPTADGNLFRFSFHEAGSPKSEPSPGHTIIVGKTGTGKSVLAGFLMAQLARVDARVIVFDYRRGLEMVTRALNGSYSTVVSGETTGLNPLQVETDPEGVDWLADWLGRILKPDGGMSTDQARKIYDVCKENARAPEHLQSWDHFAKQFVSSDDDGELHGLVSEWGDGGRFGWVFGRSKEDSFSLDGDVVGFDLTQILDAESERERMAVLSYIFRRLERQLRDKRRTVVIIDEAWKAVDNPYFAEKIKGWLVTLRKLNAVVVMMTQNPAQLSTSKVGSGIYASFSTRILLPNPTASADEFTPLRLSEKELAFVLGSPSNRSVLISDDGGSTILDANLAALGKLVHVIGGGPTGETIVGTDYRNVRNFWERAL